MFQPLPGCLAAIIAYRVAGATLLDVGAGVGAVHLTLLEDGAARPSTGGCHAASCTLGGSLAATGRPAGSSQPAASLD
jgi:hypothetical protein